VGHQKIQHPGRGDVIKGLPSRDQLLNIYSTMLLSRRFDEACGRLVSEKKPVPHFHSGIGQEALMVASVAPLRSSDRIIYTHRGYGHLLAKGIPLREIALDMFLREGGTNNGYGGVMHVNRPELGVPGREGVFGTRFAIAVGFAMADQRRKSENVTVCFYGEAAGARGQVYEALNMAVLWQLPVIFIAENNGWSVSSRTEWLYPEARMSRVWRGFEIPVAVIDGNDVQAIYSEVSNAAGRARQGNGPSVIEGLTYRIDPHIWWDDAAYQPRREIEEWAARDPIKRVSKRLLDNGCTDEALKRIDAEARDEVARVMKEVQSAIIPTWSGERVSGR
jgi:pyruvate dehydrogenase E1 component alpha subunit